MNGVIVLQEFSNVAYSWGWTPLCWVWFAMLWIAIGMLVCCLKRYINKQSVRTLPLIIAIMMFIFGTIGVFQTASHAEKTEYKSYQVLLNDDVKVTEFRSHYEILGEQGITYIVRER